jgi:D-arabinose 1-dehydrogenase
LALSGRTGYPIATLLRLAILALRTPPYLPLDVVLSYSHLTLQNSTLISFASHFHSRARVPQLLAASPLSMGLLTASPPPWHPAPKRLLQAASDAFNSVDMWPGRLPNLAQGFSLKAASGLNGGVPLLVGFSEPDEVHKCMKVWREVTMSINEEERRRKEVMVREIFEKASFLDWSWSSP